MAVSGATAAEKVEGTEAQRPVLDGAERAGLQTQIRAEIERRRPRPVALRTLELLAAAAVEPAEGQPGYRVIDRHGLPRTRAATAEGAEGATAPPMTLADLIDEIAERHPALFLPPEAAPAPAEPAPESGLGANAAEMRAATARFVETQSERARALAERSSEQGRALAQSAAAAFADLRARLDRSRGAEPADPGAAGAVAEAPARHEGAQDRLRRFRAGLQDWRDGGLGGSGSRGRLAGAAAATLALVVGAGLVLSYRGAGEDTSAPAPQAASPAQPQSQAAAPAEAPPAETESAPEEAPRPAPNAVTGQAQVIDTATLRLNGKLVRLFGVEWVRGGQADELTRYINNRPVTCQPVPGSENQLCQIEGRDLSEVVLFNGGGRASPEATPELVAAEDHARSERLGVWKR